MEQAPHGCESIWYDAGSMRGITVRRLLVLSALGSAACAGGAGNPFGDEAIASITVGHSGGATETGSSEGSSSQTSGDPDSGNASASASASASGPTSSATDTDTGEGGPCEVAADCDGGDACTQATCDPVSGCMYAAIDCDDNDPCTTDTCDPVQGCANETIMCDDGVSCTQDSCDPGTGQCIHVPNDTMCGDADACNGVETCDTAMGCLGGTPVVCNDGNACTQNVCNSGSGQCSHPAIVACASNDGCCPLGCSVAADNDCVCTNLANSATATSSGGGSNGTGFGPSNLNDGVTRAQCVATSCQQCFAWMSNSSSSTGWFELQWNSAVTIGSMYVEGEHATNPSCGSTGRNLAAGDVQWWNGNAWINATAWAGNVENLFLEFNPPLQTTRVRLANVVSGPGNGNSMAFEWYVYQPLGCTP